MEQTFRPGAVGALLDEYERAIQDLLRAIADISDDDLVQIADGDMDNASCQSIQTVLSHVVRAGYAYAVDIRNYLGADESYPGHMLHNHTEDYRKELSSLFDFTLDTFGNIEDGQLEQTDNNRKITTPWGQVYDIEQLTEHAIVHVLRHRRQIIKFKNRLKK